ncbi:hypothetical protein NHG24_07225 [Aerococcaceae bacterium NML210727]|nr:hypothetical protein [Aerococcaceae bacterium NML210727]MCW6654933.1 hypothetical protein [Aerococcaceae bacterium NML201296]
MRRAGLLLLRKPLADRLAGHCFFEVSPSQYVTGFNDDEEVTCLKETYQ